MKLKKIVKVGPHIVEVNYPYVFTERSDVDALACTRTKKIYVRDNAEGEQMPDMCIAENMFHELLHHVCYQATGSLTLFDDENKHEVFSNYLFMVMVENGFRFLGKGQPIDWMDWSNVINTKTAKKILEDIDKESERLEFDWAKKYYEDMPSGDVLPDIKKVARGGPDGKV